MIPTEIPQWYRMYITQKALATTLTISGVIGVLTAGLTPKDWKPFPLLGTLAVSIAALKVRELADEAEQYLQDAEVIAKVQRQRDTMHSFSGAQAEKPSEVPALFDWRRFYRDRDKFPHVMILGATGSGKSTLGEYIGYLIGGTTKVLPYVVSPHLSPSDFAGFGKRLGDKGYGTFSNTKLVWDDIKNAPEDQVSIAQVFQALYHEMEKRYEAYHKGEPTGDPIELFWDEVPACFSNLPELRAIVPKLLMEARKVGIRLWVLAQGQTVQLLGLENKGDLKESFTQVRLGEFAVNHADWLLSVERATEKEYNWLKSQDNPCMVGDEFALIPDLRLLQEVVSTLQTVAQPMPQYPPDTHPVPLTETPELSEGEEKARSLALEGLTLGNTKEDVIRYIWRSDPSQYDRALELWQKLGLP